ncbi:hypothetical protein GCM10025867_16390 [Frondihabitans sucicola]|uniref:HTH cro/C1-type domain-containing protein n=1 Tax=Frondihabitans sucicola TaxID=1268041 RepID=A0ABM8GM00_9MICO|nr:helix-turn-helix transcriptional regulator [Frondihabitans sucicola]BDZ49398.1 hypothetical protein GCM10025867_16390 [Frondihabitans sucicola]
MIIDRIRAEAETLGIAVTDLAARAGLSRASAYRLMSGEISPRLDDLRELAIAAGYDLDVRLVPLSDPAAAAAARILLGDRDLHAVTDSSGADASIGTPLDVRAWIERLQRLTDGTPESIIVAAGHAASLQNRAGIQGLWAPSGFTIDRLVSAGRASRADWALSGSAAFDAMGREAPGPTILYTTDQRTITQLLSDTFTVVDPRGAPLLVVEADRLTFSGAEAVEQVNLVTPTQAIVDAIGLGGRLAEVALDAIREAR